MKTHKRIIAAIMGAVCMIGAVMPVVPGAEEATYDPADVDRNGVVNLTDSITINQYLSGYTTTDDYARLDANQNLIVDIEDSVCVLAKAVGVSYSSKFMSRKTGQLFSFPSISSNIIYPTENETSRDYIVYNYLSRSEGDPYTLSPSSRDSFNQVGGSLYSIVDGEESRVPATGAECTGIVHLDGIGTGFIVSNHVIATAAHCVYNYDKKIFRDMTIYTYDEEGLKTGKTLTPVEVHVTSEYVNNKSSIYDYALITVAEDLSDYTHFSLAPTYNVSPTNFSHIPIYVTGFPAEVYDKKTGKYIEIEGEHMYTDEGRITGSSDISLSYNTDATGGNSGSPVYTITRTVSGNGDVTYTYSAMAIHAYNGNSGARINKYLIQFYLNNPYTHH